ncbi:MAG: LLM class flavin-dependent oxidoreductase [Candidatus Binatia bacterium]
MGTTAETRRQYWGGVSPYLGERLPAVAQHYEAQGLYGLFAGQGWGPPWTALAAAAAVTRRLQLGSAIAIAGVRSPFETALVALDLDRISGGRFVLGMGTSTRWVTEGFFGAASDRPLARLRETVLAVRHVIHGAHRGLQPFRGTWFKADFAGVPPQPPPVREHIPIWLGALGRQTTILAGEIADGVLGHPLWGIDWWLGPVQDHLRQGLKRSGRTLSGVHRCPYLTVLINSDRREAIRDAQRSIAGYAVFEQYNFFFDALGFGDVARRIQALSGQGASTDAADAVPEAMVQALAVAGNADAVRQQVERVWQAAESIHLAPPVWGVPPERVAFYQKAIADTFYG